MHLLTSLQAILTTCDYKLEASLVSDELKIGLYRIINNVYDSNCCSLTMIVCKKRCFENCMTFNFDKTTIISFTRKTMIVDVLYTV
jgi:hypothetical protein